ncbi:MAG: hypothetical protein ABJJ25_07080 [Eudoraea sp.]|uniref:hypothetical protein n=1 Tax=Eudoraea sp. TaxID=1979955 RepID=UPI003264EB03
MKNILILFLCFFFSQPNHAHDQAPLIESSIDDPIELSKKIINEGADSWNEDAKQRILETYGSGNSAITANKNYILLESPSLVFDYFQGGFANSQELLSKDLFLKILNQAVNSPDIVSAEVAKASQEQSLKEYLLAYEIVKKFKDSNSLSNEDAIKFLENRFGYNKLSFAKNLTDASSENYNTVTDKKKSKKVISKINFIKKTYPSQIPLINALAELEEFYHLLQEANIGLTAYVPYNNFKNSVYKLNKQRISERIQWRSSLEIKYPTNGTVWIAPGPVDIEWTTSNMDESKNIKFFLTRDDVVVQELGVFKNNHFEKDVKLRKGLPAGNKYKIMGIELFPLNKYHIAKYATPYFTIKKEDKIPEEIIVEAPAEIVETPADVVEIPIEVKEVTVEPVPEPAKVVKKPATPIQKPIETIAVVEEEKKEIVVKEEVKIPNRTVFEGRKISYQKELVVDNEIITISLYDHGRADGDIVSIYLNGEQIVAKHILTYKKKSFEVKLNSNKSNDLFLYAHNLGNFPPNTVSIEIKDGSSAENIVLNSDLSSCEAVLINVKQ